MIRWLTGLAVLALLVVELGLRATVHAAPPPNIPVQVALLYDAAGNGLATVGGSSSASATLLVSFPASAPAGIAATGPVNVAQWAGSDVRLGNATAAQGLPVNVTSSAASAAVNTGQWGGVDTRLGNATAAQSVPVTAQSIAASMQVSVYGGTTAVGAFGLGDSRSNSTNALAASAFCSGFNDTTTVWDRCRAGVTNSAATTGFLNFMGGRQVVTADGASATLTDYVGSVNAIGEALNSSGTFDRTMSGNPFADVATAAEPRGWIGVRAMTYVEDGGVGARRVQAAEDLGDGNAGTRFPGAQPMAWNPSNSNWNRLGNPAIAEGATHALSIAMDYRYSNLTTSASSLLKATPGLVRRINVNTIGTTSTAKLYDNSSCAAGVTMVPIASASTVAVGPHEYDVKTSTGICVVTAGGAAADLTVVWR